ncbi:acyl-CoA thioesterase II [Pseudomonas aeruginosa]|nr:acyl-CoA thioesterase II [Pseudomonas aeruginosa]
MAQDLLISPRTD